MITIYKLYVRVNKADKERTSVKMYNFCIKEGSETEVTNYRDELIKKFKRSGFTTEWHNGDISLVSVEAHALVRFEIKKEDKMTQEEWNNIISTFIKV